MKLSRFLLVTAMVCAMFMGKALAQSGKRYAEPVFDEVNVVSGIPYSSAVKEGQTTPTTLYLDFYEPQGDTLSSRPLVITVFGGAFVTGSRDFVDMVEYCTRLAKHGYAAASIDYRLLSLLNLSHSSLVRTAYMAAQDVSSSIRFFKAHCEEYRIDPSQVFLLGNSAGSIALLCELFMEEDERPEETFESPDLGSMHSSGFDEYAGFSPAVSGAIPQWGGVISCDIIGAEEYVPLCMIHGTDDATVPIDSGFCYSSSLFGLMPYMYGSQTIANHLNNMGISDYGFYPFEGEGHAFYYTLLYQLNDQFDVCFDIARDFLFEHLNSTASLTEGNEDRIQVYPNPASDLLKVCAEEMVTNKPFTIVIVDVTGRVMMEMESFSQEVTVDISHWPTGVYSIRMERAGLCNCSTFVKR